MLSKRSLGTGLALAAAVLLLAGLVRLFTLPGVRALLQAAYLSKDLVAWASVVVNLAVVIVALFLNILLEHYRRPRFGVTCSDRAPWQVEKATPQEPDVRLLHVRLRIENIGRSYEEACEVRIERVLKLAAQGGRPEVIEDHDPRPLKWAGRNPSPIALERRAFDYVDLGVIRSDTLPKLTLDFDNRGQLDLWLSDDGCPGYRVVGTVYGKSAEPQHFAFDLCWSNFEFGPVRTTESV